MSVQATHFPAFDMYELGSGHWHTGGTAVALKTNVGLQLQAPVAVLGVPGLFLPFKGEQRMQIPSRRIEEGGQRHLWDDAT